MAMRRPTLLPGTLFLLSAANSQATTCEGLRSLDLASTEIVAAQEVRAGPVQMPSYMGEPAAMIHLPAHCRVAGVLRPTPDSLIRFETWMPVSGWNGRFEGVGNGNYAGMLSIEALAHGVLRGSAIATTDTGHSSTPADPQASAWGSRREKVIDFGYRAIHEMTRVSKQLVRAYYGVPPRNSYFVSCSNGGRQGLMSAQRYPQDYDGIVAGAPARSWTRLNSTFMAHHRRFTLDPETRLPEGKVALLAQAVTRVCDGADGLVDGVIDDPRLCRFDTASLQCRGEDAADCLTVKQIETVRLLRQGTSTPAFARLPGLPPGTESDAWTTWIFGLPPMRSGYDYLGTPFFRDLLYNDPAWTPAKFDLDRDSAAARRELSPILDADDPDLRRYFARGGKLILYTGWLDPAIPALDTIEYYDDVRRRVGADVADRHMRLFVVPGMAHCGDGPGFTSFGQWYNGTGRPRDDVRAALFRWVERGSAPATLAAARSGASLWTDPRVGMKPGESRPTRLVCAYPRHARWIGTGSTDEAANFACSDGEDAAR